MKHYENGDKKIHQTEFKAEVKKEAFQEFDTHEQIGMDFITSQHFDTLANKPNVSSILTQMKTEKTEIKEEIIEDFESHEQVGIDYITSKDFDHLFVISETSKMKTELKTEVKEDAFKEFDTQEQIGISLLVNILIIFQISLIFFPSKKRSNLMIKLKMKSRKGSNLRQVYNEVWKYWKSLNIQ